MRIKGAMTILNKQASLLGVPFHQLITFIERSPMAQPQKVLEAHETFKMDQGFRWKGTEGDTWVLRDTL